MTGESTKENVAPSDAQEYESQRSVIEHLKGELNRLQFELADAKNNASVKAVELNNEVRRANERADEEFKKKQAADTEKENASRHAQSLQQELDTLREQQEKERRNLERSVREAQDESRRVKEEIEDVNAAKDEASRFEERKVATLKMQIQRDENRITELEGNLQSRDVALEQAQHEVDEKTAKIAELEAEKLRLKAQTGDEQTMALIRQELSEQVAHIRRLETANREQLTELRHLRQSHKAVAIVEEEKASLLRKLENAEEAKAELATERRQRERLEAERLAWAAYLQQEGQAEFDSPEAMARALVQERYTSASLVEKIGTIQSQVAEREAIIQGLEEEKKSLAEKANTSGSVTTSADKSRLRLERQRTLAEKEIKLLREQLKMYESEDITFQPEKYDEQKSQRIQELEALVDQSKAEVNALHEQMSCLESSTDGPTSNAGTKRPAPIDDDESPRHEQIGQLTRKNRTLQDDLDSLQTKYKVLEKELSVMRAQLDAAKQSSGVRILELRDNPTARHESVKQAAIAELRSENNDLRKLLQDGDATNAAFPVVPVSTLVALQRDLQNARDETASALKKCRRLKEVWSDKSAEFKEAVFALLGWHVTFIPTNKMRVESVYYASETEEHERSITFDGDRGSMKFGGGPRSEFATKLEDLTEYWVRGKNCIPGFLAALTLEFFELAEKEGRV